jgi:hypothetical protein
MFMKFIARARGQPLQIEALPQTSQCAFAGTLILLVLTNDFCGTSRQPCTPSFFAIEQ